MGQEPSDIRQQIEDTRANMGDTIEAIGYRADVPARARESISGKVESIKSRVTGAAPDAGQVKDRAGRAASTAQENPVGLAIGAAALGFLAGLLVPATRVENEKIGPIADDLKQKAVETGQEALEHGKEVAQEVAQSARETVQESGQEHAEQLRESAQEKAQDAGQNARQQAPIRLT